MGTQQRSRPRSIEIVQRSRKAHRAALPRARLVCQHEGPDRPRETVPVPANLITSCGRAGAAHPVPRQCHSLQLALVPALGTGEILNTHARDRRRPLGAGRELPTRVTSVGGRYHSRRLESPTRRKPGSSSRTGRPSSGRAKLQRPDTYGRGRGTVILGTAAAWCRPRRLHDVRSQGEGGEIVLSVQAGNGLNPALTTR